MTIQNLLEFKGPGKLPKLKVELTSKPTNVFFYIFQFQ